MIPPTPPAEGPPDDTITLPLLDSPDGTVAWASEPASLIPVTLRLLPPGGAGEVVSIRVTRGDVARIRDWLGSYLELVEIVERFPADG